MQEVGADKMNKAKKIIPYLPVIFVLLSISFRIIPDWLDLFDVMVGKEGLKNVIAALIFAMLSRMMICVPIIFLGVGAAVFSVQPFKDRKNGGGRLAALLITLAVLFIPIGIVGMINFTDDFDNAKYALYSADGKRHNDFQLLAYCISDYFSDEYDTYTVNKVYFDDGLSSRYSRREYELSGYYYDILSLTLGNNEELSAQVGREDYNYLKNSLPNGFDIAVSVYRKSRYIRSFEPSVEFGRDESYEHIFQISANGDKIVRSDKMAAFELDNLTWCEFRKNESDDISNALCIISAEKSLEYPYLIKGDEICLFACMDGGYKKVSNIIYKEETSQ